MHRTFVAKGVDEKVATSRRSLISKKCKMATLEKIQKRVNMPYSLKHYFSSFSDEFKKFDYSEKIDFLRSVVQKGFSTYDLSEAFRKPREDRYSHDDMQKELVRYIAYELYRYSGDIIVSKYYKGMSDSEVAKDLDAFLLSEDAFEDFKVKFKEKFGLEI